MTLKHTIDNLEQVLRHAGGSDPAMLLEAQSLFETLRNETDALTRRQAELGALYEIARELASIIDRSELLQLILTRALALVQGERGFIVLTDKSPAGFQVAVARQFAADEKEGAESQISRSLITRVLTSRAAVVTTNAQEDPRFQASNSIVSYRIRSVMAVPLVYEREVLGAIYVDTRISARLFTQEDLDLLKAMANQAATAIRLARLYTHLETRNRQLQEALSELRATQDELIRSERLSAVGRLASAIIHDFKTPMTVIKVHASFLGQADLPAGERRRSLAHVNNALDSLVEMSQEIIDFVQGGGELRMEAVGMGDFVSDVLAAVRDDMAERRITVTTDVRYDGPITLDRNKMRRVMINLAGSARDSMGNRGGALRLGCAADAGAIRITLADDGPGIAPDVLPHLFEPFETYGKAQGTGLGLAISKKIVEDHGGAISVASEIGSGTTFTVKLPLPRL